MNHYIEIPYDQFGSLWFPKVCPFTLRSNPDTRWEVRGKTRSKEAFSIPGVLMVTKNRNYNFSIPVDSRFARTQRLLNKTMWLLIALFLLFILISMIFRIPQIVGAIAFVSSPVIFLPVLLQKWRQRHVWIDYVGTDFVEVVFKKRKYADEFCRLNGLTFRRKLINFRAE